MTTPSVDPRWAEATEQLLVDTVTNARSRPVASGRAPAGLYRRRTQLLVTAATAILLATVSWVVLEHHLPSDLQAASPVPSVSVGGKTLPYAGHIPWSRPLAESTGARDVVIYADGDRIQSSIFICGLPVERVQVIETAQTVTIAVNGYAEASPGFCGSPASPPQPLLVTLRQPLGGRTLIDRSDGQARPLTTGSPTAVASSRAAAEAFPATAGQLRENAQRTTATARKTALALLDHAPLPPRTERATSTSIPALQRKPITAGCVPSAVVWRLLRIPDAKRDVVSKYLREHPASGFTRVNASSLKSKTTLVRGLAQSTSRASLQYDIAQEGSAVAISATAFIYPGEADCAYRATYGGFHTVEVEPTP